MWTLLAEFGGLVVESDTDLIATPRHPSDAFAPRRLVRQCRFAHRGGGRPLTQRRRALPGLKTEGRGSFDKG